MDQQNGKWIVKDASVVLGGMSVITASCPETVAALVGQEWCDATLHRAMEVLAKERRLEENVVGGMPYYRMTLCTSFLFKFYCFVLRNLGLPLPPGGDDVAQIQSFKRPAAHGLQHYGEVSGWGGGG